MKLNIKSPLTRSLSKTRVTQKALAYDTGLSRATINNYTAGGNVQPNEAVDIANVLRDPEMSMEIGNMMLGLFKSFNGDAFYHDLRALDAFDEKESGEEQAAYTAHHIRQLISMPQLTPEQDEELQDWLDEVLDAVLMKITLLVAGTEALGTTPMDLLQARIPYYKAQHYMKGDDPTWEA
jgi:DNA-binding XRE family transcriptional regulator